MSRSAHVTSDARQGRSLSSRTRKAIRADQRQALHPAQERILTVIAALHSTAAEHDACPVGPDPLAARTAAMGGSGGWDLCRFHSA